MHTRTGHMCSNYRSGSILRRCPDRRVPLEPVVVENAFGPRFYRGSPTPARVDTHMRAIGRTGVTPGPQK